ncbi:MAG: tetratricopeptide repeat protein, partial [Nitrospirae bacterium]
LKHRYVGLLSFALNYKLDGFNVTGYHIVNLFIHIISGLLVYLIALLSFRTPFLSGSMLKDTSGYIALFSALLFVSHPVQTEAVTYIFQRFASLTGLFYMLSVALYLKWRVPDQRPEGMTGRLKPLLWYWGSVASAVLAMKTKQNAITLPVMIAVFEFSLFTGEIKARAVKLLPLFATCLIIPATYLMDMGYDVEHATTGAKVSRIDYLINQFPAVVKYFRLLILPIGQNLDHDYQVYQSFFEPKILISFLLLAAILGFAGYLFQRSRTGEPGFRLAALGIVWFFVTISIESSLIPNANFICEYRIYLPSAGIFISAATLFVMAVTMPGRRPGVKAAAGFISLAVVVSLSVASYARNGVWRDEITLWEDVVSKSPLKARGYLKLGHAYDKQGRSEKALQLYNRSLALDPGRDGVYYSLGHTYAAMGNYDKALSNLTQAIAVNPNFAEAFMKRGITYFEIGQHGQALADFERAISAKPYYSEAYSNRGAVYFAGHNYGKAIEDWNHALALNPGLEKTYYRLGIAYSASGDIQKAIENFSQACSRGDVNGCRSLQAIRIKK